MTVKLLNVFKEVMLKNRRLRSPVLSRKLFLEKSFRARMTHYLPLSDVFRKIASNSNAGQKEQVTIPNVTSLFVLASSHFNLTHSLWIQTLSFSTLPLFS